MNFMGLDVLVSEAAYDMELTDERLFPYSRHRSRRIWKKLRKRYGGEFKHRFVSKAYQMGNTLIVHPIIYEEMKRHAPQSRHS